MSEKPMLGGCCVCLDERGWAENPLVYCDGQSCNVAVHQACYGIIKVPSGPWFCRKCESQERAAKVKCELCPHRDGALKRTDGGGWAHVVCALYIPEVTFGSVSSMEPIILQKVPPERFSKTCYICEEESRSSKATTGACMTCAKQGCKGTFHVTCAQMAGMLCEEASGGNQTKYCGYCKTHLAKMKKTSSYKSLSCTKVYKLPTTSSSDELTTPERAHCILPEASMKPGHIRYTKAGKKRSKSLEDSLGMSTHENEGSSAENIDSISTMTTAAAMVCNNLSSPAPTQSHVALEDLESTPVPVISVEPVSMTPGIQVAHSPSKTSEAQRVKNLLAGSEVESSIPITKPVSSELLTMVTEQMPALESKHTGLTLSSLAEAASALSHSSTDATEDTTPATVKTNTEDSQSKIRSSSTTAQKKRKKDNKKSNRPKHKKDFHSDLKHKSDSRIRKKDKNSHSGIVPHRPVPPSMTSTPLPVLGSATFPRHSVVSLANMGLDRMETYEPHEIGDNNKIYTPDFSVDGLTALECLAEEQERDTMEFFREYGTTPDVAALIQTLHSVREENSYLQSTIEQMSRRRDQLLLIKTRLSGLQTNYISSTTGGSTQHSNTAHQQSQASSGQAVTVTYSSVVPNPPPIAPQQQHLAYPMQQPVSYSRVPTYTAVTTK